MVFLSAFPAVLWFYLYNLHYFCLCVSWRPDNADVQHISEWCTGAFRFFVLFTYRASFNTSGALCLFHLVKSSMHFFYLPQLLSLLCPSLPPFPIPAFLFTVSFSFRLMTYNFLLTCIIAQGWNTAVPCTFQFTRLAENLVFGWTSSLQLLPKLKMVNLKGHSRQLTLFLSDFMSISNFVMQLVTVKSKRLSLIAKCTTFVLRIIKFQFNFQFLSILTNGVFLVIPWAKQWSFFVSFFLCECLVCWDNEFFTQVSTVNLTSQLLSTGFSSPLFPQWCTATRKWK